jgi:ribosomal protein L31E
MHDQVRDLLFYAVLVAKKAPRAVTIVQIWLCQAFPQANVLVKKALSKVICMP